MCPVPRTGRDTNSWSALSEQHRAVNRTWSDWRRLSPLDLEYTASVSARAQLHNKYSFVKIHDLNNTWQSISTIKNKKWSENSKRILAKCVPVQTYKLQLNYYTVPKMTHNSVLSALPFHIGILVWKVLHCFFSALSQLILLRFFAKYMINCDYRLLQFKQEA